ncbi:hypothetical protein EON67_06335 [archaeon]|nr:MAG: hypothetical protein EON67_06335 [archaeon]
MAAAANAGRGALGASGSLASTTKSARAGAKPAGKAADNLTRAGLKQKAIALRRDIELKLTAIQQLEDSIASQTEDAHALSTLLAERHDAVAALEMQATSVQREINTALYEKQKAVETISALARLLQRFELLEAGKMPPLTADEASRVLERLAQAEEMQRNVRKLVMRLATEHADLAEVLDRVAQLIDIAPRL